MDFNRDSFINGELLLINKPIGWTSFQVVNKIRWLIKSSFDIKKIKVGHAGTLDPLATGILPIALGEATKTVSFLMDAQKTYEFTLTFGENTDTLDKEGKVILVHPSQDSENGLPIA